MDAYAPIIVAVCAVLFALLVWGVVAEILRIRRGEEHTVQPLVAARPDIKPRCQASHCGNAAMPEPVRHVHGTDMLVCPGHLEQGLRDGWIEQSAVVTS